MSSKSPSYPEIEIGILGGTGLYDIDGIQNLREVKLETPFGNPSDVYTVGTLEGKEVAFLSRHGRGHTILPSEINYQANIYGFKRMGAARIISVNSVGSLKEHIKPRDVFIPDQFFDRTPHRRNSFFGDGAAAHISFANPVCPVVSRHLHETGTELGLDIHLGGTYICIEGPSFSTIAESNIYRSWGCDVIGMTAVTEAKLSREAEICYAALNLITDYDVWHETEGTVSVEMILENLKLNVQHAKNILKKAVAGIPLRKETECECGDALNNCLMTNPDMIPGETRRRLQLILNKYIT
jgi:5'-methylthioadenosine phosphorylase